MRGQAETSVHFAFREPTIILSVATALIMRSLFLRRFRHGTNHGMDRRKFIRATGMFLVCRFA
jgi:hypothetical protein